MTSTSTLVSPRALAKRSGLDKALDALDPYDTLVITNLERPVRSKQKMLDLAEELRERNVGPRVLNLGGGVDTETTMVAMVFIVMLGLAQMELEIKRERITDSVTKRCTSCGALAADGPRSPTPKSAPQQTHSGRLTSHSSRQRNGDGTSFFIHRDYVYKYLNTLWRGRSVGPNT